MAVCSTRQSAAEHEKKYSMYSLPALPTYPKYLPTISYSTYQLHTPPTWELNLLYLLYLIARAPNDHAKRQVGLLPALASGHGLASGSTRLSSCSPACQPAPHLLKANRRALVSILPGRDVDIDMHMCRLPICAAAAGSRPGTPTPINLSAPATPIHPPCAYPRFRLRLHARIVHRQVLHLLYSAGREHSHGPSLVSTSNSCRKAGAARHWEHPTACIYPTSYIRSTCSIVG